MEDLSDYSDLPLILVKETPFQVYSPSSFGLIVYAVQTQRWFLIKRRHTHAFFIILRGGYQDAMLPDYISKLTHEEAGLLRNVLDNRAALIELIFEIRHTTEDHDINYIYTRLQYSKEIILTCLDLGKHKDEPEWLWPKGRKEFGREESSRMAAVREFVEESGLELSQISHTLLPEPYTYNNTGFLGCNYNIVLWVCLLETEVEVKQPGPLDVEVSERGWFSNHEANSRLSGKKRTVMESVNDRIKRYLNIREVNEPGQSSELHFEKPWTDIERCDSDF